ncbi:GNAT family N-acetyltransferase [Pseudidiomarina insulisalsae]|uniref:N-acetyltransferase domain-containing protein n=1 Tax=Pseudidiomarina insulisalsae TaxID=575789 RepID=A0A432YHR1_9GAMM|nr:GNAT family N-acetyltransferase [Pseudidiomarina insulisalsae]RUO60474.1 hypothetical protein CWI71_06280 [Pseudidiomarina insulisalsae]
MLEQWLTQLKAARQRAVFIFSAATADERAHIHARLQALLSDALWLADAAGQYARVHRYRDYLGLTQQHVVMDFQQLIHADALAALAGTVEGGGCLWLILPVHSSPFQQRLCRYAQSYPLVCCFSHWRELIAKLETTPELHLPGANSPGFPSAEQQQLIKKLQEAPKQTHVIVADRGRGKSTALGLAARTLSSAAPLLVTAPQPAAVTTLLQHAGASVQFRAWDKLLHDTKSYGQRLIIDEAAALPLHILKQLIEHYEVWAIATTVDGYEGCGKGFVLRFVAWLQHHADVRMHRLVTPLRWSPADNCEPWLHEVLLLAAPVSESGNARNEVLTLRQCHASELTEEHLRQTMALLLEAHYQSSPNDLRLLLDDSRQRLLLSFYGTTLVGVCWLAAEGPLPVELQAAVVEGRRRVKGELLPQALGFYRQQPQCLNWRWLRVVRIAVAADQRRHGIATAMLGHIADTARNQGFDALGTSFGISAEVLRFWQHTNFRELRRGLKKNPASGSVSAIWGYGLTPRAQHQLQQLGELQTLELAWQQGATIDPVAPDLFAICQAIIKGFVRGFLPLSNVRFAWYLLWLQQRNPVFDYRQSVFDPTVSIAALSQAYAKASRAELEQWLRGEASNFLTQTASRC